MGDRRQFILIPFGQPLITYLRAVSSDSHSSFLDFQVYLERHLEHSKSSTIQSGSFHTHDAREELGGDGEPAVRPAEFAQVHLASPVSVEQSSINL